MSSVWSPGAMRHWARAHPGDIVDVFVYVVVLNLAVEYVPAVISEGFTLSLVTAVLLKIALEIVLMLKGRLKRRLRAATTARAKVGSALLIWLLAGRQQVRGPRAGEPGVR